jgi:glycosyltransferase involved in cell wall biosynthesis
MVYLEPAPYIIGLVDEVRASWQNEVDVVFVAERLTQPWPKNLDGKDYILLPSEFGASLREIYRLLASRRYSLLHIAGWGHPLLLGAILFSAWFRIPLVAETDTPLRDDLPRWKWMIKKVFYPLLFRIPAMFLPAGSRQAAYLRYYGVEERRIKIAKMTVDVAKYSAYAKTFSVTAKADVLRRHNLSKSTFKILYVGRIEEHNKAISQLIEIYRILREDTNSVSLLVVGTGSKRDDIIAFGKNDHSVHYLGGLWGERLLDIYCICDVLILPSRYESWGLAINEAMAFGLPVVVSNRVGCLDDLVVDGKTGLVYPFGANARAVLAIKKLIANNELRANMAVAAKQLISSWTLKHSAENTISAWQSALA